MMTKVSGKTLAKSLVAIALALACSPSIPAVGPSTATLPPSPSASTAVIEPTPSLAPSPLPSAQAVAEATDPPVPTSRPTSAPTPTVWPPVLALWSLTDIRSLDSFVLELNERNTNNGQLTERTITIGYIREPYGAFHWIEHRGGMERVYAVNDRTYELTATGDWYISTGPTDNLFNETVPAWGAGRLVEAEFADEEEYAGAAAYHFVLDGTTSTDSNPDTQLEGELYVAREGNYMLYSHWLETGTGGATENSYELTYALSSIGQLAEITLPADMEEMASAADLPFDGGLPLPPGSAFLGMIRYAAGIGVDTYQLSTPKTSIEEFLNSYRNLPETEGWRVTHVGHVSLHQDDCEFTEECVILDNGSAQVILFYNGVRIRAEYDWRRLYSPVE